MKTNEKSFKLSIGNKIFIGFSILIVIYMGMALSSYSDMVEINTLSEQAVPLSSQLNSLQEFAISTEVLDLDFRKTESLGLHLVTILAENQLHGEINLILKGGTEFHIKFRGIK